MANKDNLDIHQRVTNHILESMAKNPNAEWKKPWEVPICGELPRNAATNKQYRGVNILSLWCEAAMKGYETPYWATYRQWKELGAQVRKGEKATPVVFWKIDGGPEKEDAEEADQNQEQTRRRVIAKGYWVFSAEQVDGWQAPELVKRQAQGRIPEAEAFLFHLGADIRHGGGEAYYQLEGDHIQMPRFEHFRTPIDYYSTLSHELGHWSGAKHRLARDLAPRFREDAYAAEELVAELTAAIQMGKLGLCSTPRPDHAPYIAHYHRILGQDPKAIFTAAAKAQAVVDFLEREHERLKAENAAQATNAEEVSAQQTRTRTDDSEVEAEAVTAGRSYQDVQGQEKETMKSFVVHVDEAWRFTKQVEVEAACHEDAEELAQKLLKESGVSCDGGTPLTRYAIALTEDGEPLRLEQGTGKPVQVLGLVLAYHQRDAVSEVLDYLWEAESKDYAANPAPEHIFKSLIVLRQLCGPGQHPETEERNSMNKYEKNHELLTKLLNSRDHVRIENEPYMPLVVERLEGTNQISLCHLGEQNGDLMRDPEVVFVTEGNEAKPKYFLNDYAGVEHATEGGLFGDVPVKPQRQKDLDNFVSMWFYNLRDQGFFERAEEVTKQENLEVAGTSSETESTTEERGENMAEEKTENQVSQKQETGREPVATMELGKLRAEVYRQQSDRGEFYSISVRRPFVGKDGSEKVAFDTREQDIRDHIAILQEAEKIIHQEKEERAKEHGETQGNRIRITRR